MELFRRRLGELTDRLVQWKRREIVRGPFIDLVIPIGDVAHIGHMLAAVAPPQEAEAHIEDNDGARISNMGEVVNGRSADIKAHIRSVDRNEFAFLARERVVELQRHGKFRAGPRVLWAYCRTPKSGLTLRMGFSRRDKGKAAAPAEVGASRGSTVAARPRRPSRPTTGIDDRACASHEHG